MLKMSRTIIIYNIIIFYLNVNIENLENYTIYMNNTLASNVVSIKYIIVVNYVSAIKMYNLYEIIIQLRDQ